MLLPPASRAVFGAVLSKSEAHPEDAADGSIAAEAIPLRERARKAMVLVSKEVRAGGVTALITLQKNEGRTESPAWTDLRCPQYLDMRVSVAESAPRQF